ncbi:MAG: DUF1402 family protein [Verrucomicrobiales bacterium]|nr:DUF1402 family protein [Verrucomicrobiales bacterium]
MKSASLLIPSLLTLSTLLPPPSVEAVTIAGREISRANYREIQRDRYYRRTEKTFNTVFYKKHFEEDNQFLLKYLIETAKIYDVPAAAVLGGIMGEHSMNQRGTFKQAGEKGINFLGKKFGASGEDVVNKMNLKFRGANGQASFGPGQIQPFIASAMQSEIKRIRPDATEDELDKYNWKGAINIICAYMNYAANWYEEAGFEVRRDTPLMVTLFNIGETGKSFEKRAAGTKALVDKGERDGPWLNYFGYWVLRNQKTLDAKIAGAGR